MTEQIEQKKTSRKRRRFEERRQGRVWALSMLYALEYVSDLGELFGSFHHLIPRCIEEPEPFEFARTVVLTIHGGLEALDGRVQESSKRWRIKRMDLIDRNILRAGAI